MRLVDYSSSEDDEPEEHVAELLKPTFALPELPSAFHDLYSVKPRIGDDPSLHEGRIRGHPHVAGQWATHAYIEFRPSPELHSLLHSIVEKVTLRRQGIKSLLFTEFGNIAPLHVSLSRPLVLWTHEKDDFLRAFTSAIQDLKSLPFQLSVADVECFINRESTRKFLVLKVNMSQQLGSLAVAVDNVVVSFDRPSLYEDPIYHISIAWGDMSCDMNNVLFDALKNEFGTQMAEIRIRVKEVKLKIGNEISTISME